MILASASSAPLILSVLSAAAYAFPALRRQLGTRACIAIVTLGWLLHGLVITLDLTAAPALFGFAPALSVTVWLVATVYGIETRIFPQLPTRWALSALGSAAVLLAAIFPGVPLPPSASIWLPLHLALGIACYGLFGMAVVHAWFIRRAERRFRRGQDTDSGLPILTLERLTYRFVTAGFILLSGTLVVGALFGEVVYGHAWKWDHKTVFSILSWITFAVLLIGRHRHGWRGNAAARVLYMGAIFLLLAYVGSRFVLEIVLGRMP